jgi:hypothetical protein
VAFTTWIASTTTRNTKEKKPMTRLSIVALAAALVAGAFAVPASAAPVGANALQGAATKFDPAASKVHYRRHRHCHWRYGRRHCHGKRFYRDSWYGPSVGIYFGKKRHYRHHHHRRGHRRHH